MPVICPAFSPHRELIPLFLGAKQVQIRGRPVRDFRQDCLAPVFATVPESRGVKVRGIQPVRWNDVRSSG